MSSETRVSTYRKGAFPRKDIHHLVTSHIERLKPEIPRLRMEELGAWIVEKQIDLRFVWGGAILLSIVTVGMGLVICLPVAGVMTFAKRLWGERGNPDRADRLVVRSRDIEQFLDEDRSFDSVMVYAEALHAVMDANLDGEEYEELAVPLKDLLQSEREAKQKRIELKRISERLSGHDPLEALDEVRSNLERATSVTTREILEQNISLLEQQQLRRETLTNHISQLAAQESLAIELMRSIGESALQLDVMPYVAVTPILASARHLVYAMDHEVLAVERAIVEVDSGHFNMVSG